MHELAHSTRRRTPARAPRHHAITALLAALALLTLPSLARADTRSVDLLTAANKEGSTIEGYTPIIAETDREALEVALGSIQPAGQPRVCHIHDTSRLEEMMVSEALFPLAKQLPNIEVLSDLQPPPFDKEGRLQWL